MYSPADRLLDADFWSTATLAEVEAELARGIDPNVTDSDSLVPSTVTPLHLAAGYAKPQLIIPLLDRGADMEARERFLDRTPIHMAASFNTNAASVALLIERGADINARDRHGDTILHAAAGYAQSAVVELLLDIGMSTEVTNDLGYTPLHKTAWNREPETAALLVSRGADKNITSNDGDTPHRIALEGMGHRMYEMDRNGSTPEQMALQHTANEALLRVLHP